MDPVIIRNAVDAWVRQDKPGRKRYNGSKLYLRSNTGGLERLAFMYFNKAWPAGALITRARLKFYNGNEWTGSNTVTVQNLASKWDIDKLKYSNMPGVLAGTATLNKPTTTPADTLWDIDVLALVQAASNSGNWFGLRLAINVAASRWIHSTQSAEGTLRPVLEVEWSEAPDEPDNPRPGGGRQVSISHPYFSADYNDVLGDTSLASIEVDIGSTEALVNAGNAEWKSGEKAATAPELNTATTAYPGITNTQQRWWRGRFKDGSGQWSPWMDAEPFGRTNKGTLTITLPSSGSPFIYSPTPTVSWSLTGATQEHYQVSVARADDPNTILWTTGKLTGTDTSVEVPFGAITDYSASYIITVRVWDTVDREETPGDPTYVQASRTVTVNDDATVAAVTGLNASSDPLLPIEILTWARSVAPSDFAIERSEDGGTTWRYIDEQEAGALSTGGTNYEYKDVTAAQYKQYQWRVRAIVADKQSANNPTASGQVRKIAPFLMRSDGTDAVCFLNPKRSRKNMDIQELHEVLDGPPVLVTQRLGGKAGTIEGRLTGDALPGVSAEEMYKRFQRLHKDSGQEMVVSIANESYRAVAYNFQDDVVTDASGVTYIVSFDWFEVPVRAEA